MTDRKIAEAMAGIERYYDLYWGISGVLYGKNFYNKDTRVSIQHYPNDLNPCWRVINGLDNDETLLYWAELQILFTEEGATFADPVKLVKANAAEVCEAILKSKGLWK